MFAVVAMNVNGAVEFLRRFGEMELKVGADAVVAMGQMDVAEAEFFGEVEVGCGAIDGDDGFDAEVSKGLETGLAFRSAARKNIGAEEIEIVDAGRIREWFGAGR